MCKEELFLIYHPFGFLQQQKSDPSTKAINTEKQLGSFFKIPVWGPTPSKLNQYLWRWGPHMSGFTSSPGDSNVQEELGTVILGCEVLHMKNNIMQWLKTEKIMLFILHLCRNKICINIYFYYTKNLVKFSETSFV